MSMATLNRTIRLEAQVVLHNPKLRDKDILEWKNAELTPEEGEVIVYLPVIGVWIAVSKAVDRRF